MVHTKLSSSIPRTLHYGIVSFLSIMMLVSIYLYSFRPHLYQWPHNAAAVLPTMICSSLWEPCTINFNTDETLSIKLTTTKLPHLSPLYIQVSTNDPSIQDISVTFSEFSAHKSQLFLSRESEGVFLAKTIIPSYSTPQQSIRLSLFLTKGATHYRIPFHFKNQS